MAIVVGKNAQDNWDIVRNANQNDLWFHVDKTSSASVVLDSKYITASNIRDAANLCKQNSKFRDMNRVKVVYCPVRNIHFGNSVGEFIIKSKRRCRVIVLH